MVMILYMTQNEGVPPITEPELVKMYGNDMVVVGNQTIQLHLALEYERLLCPADEQSRQDPQRRVAYIAGILAAAGTLQPEHEHLLPTPEKE
jgi:hypothetical protein